MMVECGQTAECNATVSEPYPIRNSVKIRQKRLKIQSIVEFDPKFGPRHSNARQEGLSKWIADGSFKVKDEIVIGLDKASETFVAMLEGRNFGKTLIKVDNDEI